MAKQNQKWRPVTETESRTGFSLWADREVDDELGWTHTHKTVIQHQETGPDMEPSGEKEEMQA